MPYNIGNRVTGVADVEKNIRARIAYKFVRLRGGPHAIISIT